MIQKKTGSQYENICSHIMAAIKKKDIKYKKIVTTCFAMRDPVHCFLLVLTAYLPKSRSSESNLTGEGIWKLATLVKEKKRDKKFATAESKVLCTCCP